MASYRYPLIAREGWGIIVLSAAMALLSFLYVDTVAGAALGGVTLALVYLCRDPGRNIPASPLAVLSPVDGRVVSVENVFEPHVEREMVRVRIRMNPLGPYSLRSPVEGKVVRQWYPGGEERQYGQLIRTDEGDEVIMAIGNVRLVRRRYCSRQSGERIGQGQRCGFIPFGAAIDLLVPGNCRTAVESSERVESGRSVIGTLVHK